MTNLYSVEGVNYKTDKYFFNTLTETIEQIRDGQKGFTALGEVICDNICVDECFVVLEHVKYDDASITVPAIDQNHMFHHFLTDEMKQMSLSRVIANLEKGKGKIGWVDRENAVLGGVFRQYKPILFISEKTLMGDHLKPEHVAAIILHEVGHLFSYYETLISMIVTNKAISDAVEDMVGKKDPIIKMKIIDGLVSDKILPENMDTEAVSKLDNEHIHQLLITTAMKESVYKNDSPLYDITLAEQQADAFATRLGAGKELAEALHVMNKKDNAYEKPPTLMMELFCFVMKSVVFLGPIYWATSWSFNYFRKTTDMYGTPYERFSRIKREMIGDLKQRTDRKEIKQLIKDLDEVEKMLSEIPDTRTRLEKFWDFVTPFLRRQSSKKEQQQAVEKLLNNDIYINALKLQDKGK